MDINVVIKMEDKTRECIDKLSSAILGINGAVINVNTETLEEPKTKKKDKKAAEPTLGLEPQYEPVTKEEPVTETVTPGVGDVKPQTEEPKNWEPQAVPIDSSKEYTLDELSKAAAAMANTKEKRAALTELLKTKYEVATMTLLDPARYGEFATDIREMGARI